MLVRVLYHDNVSTVEVGEKTLYNVPHYRLGTLAQRANQHGKVYATPFGWACRFQDEYKHILSGWLLTVPSICFTEQ